MITLAIGLCGLLCSQVKQPAGYVVKVVGTVTLIQSSTTKGPLREVTLTAAQTRRRVPIYDGFKFRIDDKTSRVVYFFNADCRRQGPPLEGGQPYYTVSTRASSMGGKRPQDGKAAGSLARFGFLIDPDAGKRLYVDANEEVRVVWWQQPGTPNLTLRVRGTSSGKSITFSLPATDRKRMGGRVGVYRIKNFFSVAGVSSQRLAQAKITLELSATGKDNVRTTWTILPAMEAVAIETDINSLNQASNSSEDDIELRNQLAIDLEAKRCAMEIAARCLDWWSADPENYAALMAAHGLAVKARASELVKLLRQKLEEKEAPGRPNSHLSERLNIPRESGMS